MKEETKEEISENENLLSDIALTEESEEDKQTKECKYAIKIMFEQ